MSGEGAAAEWVGRPSAIGRPCMPASARELAVVQVAETGRVQRRCPTPEPFDGGRVQAAEVRADVAGRAEVHPRSLNPPNLGHDSLFGPLSPPADRGIVEAGGFDGLTPASHVSVGGAVEVRVTARNVRFVEEFALGVQLQDSRHDIVGIPAGEPEVHGVSSKGVSLRRPALSVKRADPGPGSPEQSVERRVSFLRAPPLA